MGKLNLDRLKPMTIDELEKLYEELYREDITFLLYVWDKCEDIRRCGITHTTIEQFDNVR